MSLINTMHLLFGQLRSVLMQLDQKEYSQPVEALSNSTLGQHLRHVIEFYHCLIIGYQSGVLNYDNRIRNRQIEEDLATAENALTEIEYSIHQMDISKSIVLEINDYSGESEYTNSITSSIARELAYNNEHTIHHMALIKVAIKSILPEILLSETFGIAPSTIKHRESQCAQ